MIKPHRNINTETAPMFSRHRLRFLAIFAFFLGSLFLGSLFCFPSANANAEEAKPNLIFFLSDDQRADFLGCAGHDIIKTPNIDQLAKEGVRFENAFVTTSICAASRATFLTGLYERGHKYTFGTPAIAREVIDVSYPMLLREAGYRTGFIGKYGVGVERDQTAKMFDVFRSLNRNPYFKKTPTGERHVTQIIGDTAIEFIEESKEGEPFCLSVSFNAAHAEDNDKENHFPWPHVVDGMYDDVTVPKPHLSEPEVFEAHPEFMKNSMNRDRFFWRWDTPEKYQKNIRSYYRMISGIDHVIGRVMKTLETNDLAQNTVIIFAGDNGYYAGSRGFAGKWSHYEESLRVPLIIFDPRLEKTSRGRVDSSLVLNVDVAPTLLALAGVKIPESFQGNDLGPLVRHEATRDWRNDFFCEHLMRNARIPKWEGVRGERYVYAHYFENDYEYLHDLKEDPQQLKNFATDPAYRETLEMMRKRCIELRDTYGSEFNDEDYPSNRKPK